MFKWHICGETGKDPRNVKFPDISLKEVHNHPTCTNSLHYVLQLWVKVKKECCKEEDAHILSEFNYMMNDVMHALCLEQGIDINACSDEEASKALEQLDPYTLLGPSSNEILARAALWISEQSDEFKECIRCVIHIDPKDV